MSGFVSALELQRRTTARSRLGVSGGGRGVRGVVAQPAVMRGMAPRALDTDTLASLAVHIDAALIRDAWRFETQTVRLQTPPELIAAAGRAAAPWKQTTQQGIF